MSKDLQSNHKIDRIDSSDQEYGTHNLEDIRSYVFRYALNKGFYVDDAEDLASDVIFSLLEFRSKLSNDSLQHIITSAINRKIKEQYRARRRNVPFYDEQLYDNEIFYDPLQIIHTQIEQEMLLKVINNLSESTRELMISYYYSQTDLSSLSLTSGLTIESLRKRLYRARKEIRSKLE